MLKFYTEKDLRHSINFNNKKVRLVFPQKHGVSFEIWTLLT